MGDLETSMAAQLAVLKQAKELMRTPAIVCLCGSTKFAGAFRERNLKETLAGRIVLSIGCDMRDGDVFAQMDAAELERVKARLDWLHLRKVELADEILVLNGLWPFCRKCEEPCGDVRFGMTMCCGVLPEERPYIGPSTRNELEHARRLGKKVRFLNPEA